MSRREKFSRSQKGQLNGHAKEQGAIVREGLQSPEDEALPPRRKKFPSSANKWSKWYYNLLFVLFVGLVAFLFWYGTTFSHQD
ncbi:hypothetical protein M6D81_15210 [Paenibacillus sp. J5C_2022]|uniref:hypothetical protein n=1 Tax=Paenibacillus sp. J5C2022 TaxID=2977129 RepID=UPI0021D040ED|nr:hypothetical protein [Paenibacillus sp. J5C2022]MCU6710044.1 hypothetical protein [Paenibacillus sp. J5C2022]